MGRRIGIGLLLALAGLVAAALFMRREPPPMPPDRDHLPALGRLTREGAEKACLDCHGPAGKKPRGPKHPLANDCARCHSLRQA